jgi:hypothetical protein
MFPAAPTLCLGGENNPIYPAPMILSPDKQYYMIEEEKFIFNDGGLRKRG